MDSGYKLWQKEKAIEIARMLTINDPAWLYEIVEDPNSVSKWCYIQARDEQGNIVGRV